MLALSAERGGDPDRPGKKDPLDCLLWLLERPGEPSWDSPFGRGRPGWHVECTAIALEHLGDQIDVQGGGSDLAFPHHEMSASEAVVATGVSPFARHYVHAGMVGYQGEKMSKSRGNLVFVSALRGDGVDPAAIRLALLGAPLPQRLGVHHRPPRAGASTGWSAGRPPRRGRPGPTPTSCSRAYGPGSPTTSTPRARCCSSTPGPTTPSPQAATTPRPPGSYETWRTPCSASG